MDCADCGCPTRVTRTTRVMKMTSRVIECACGSRFETLEKITGRLSHATSKQVGSTAYVHTGSSLMSTGDHGRSQVITGNLPVAMGGLGGLSYSAPSGSGSDLILSPSSSVPLIRGRARVARTGPDQAPAAFLAFWEIYPRRVAKVAALRAWIKINPSDDLIQIIMASMAWQSELFLTRDPENRPHPATWLNQRRWEDERPPVQIAATAPGAPSQDRNYKPPKLKSERRPRIDPTHGD
jgi:hypothetical protein